MFIRYDKYMVAIIGGKNLILVIIHNTYKGRWDDMG